MKTPKEEEEEERERGLMIFSVWWGDGDLFIKEKRTQAQHHGLRRWCAEETHTPHKSLTKYELEQRDPNQGVLNVWAKDRVKG